MQSGTEPELGLACPFCDAVIGQPCRMQDWVALRRRDEVVFLDAVHIHKKRVQALSAAITQTITVLGDEDADQVHQGRVILTVPGPNGRWRVKASLRLGENTFVSSDLLFKHVSWQRHWLDAWDRARQACRALGLKEIQLEEYFVDERGWTLEAFEKNSIELRKRLEIHK
jgi:hypothetical protein